MTWTARTFLLIFVSFRHPSSRTLPQSTIHVTSLTSPSRLLKRSQALSAKNARHQFSSGLTPSHTNSWSSSSHAVYAGRPGGIRSYRGCRFLLRHGLGMLSGKISHIHDVCLIPLSSYSPLLDYPASRLSHLSLSPSLQFLIWSLSLGSAVRNTISIL